jgi:hypothetical protein
MKAAHRQCIRGWGLRLCGQGVDSLGGFGDTSGGGIDLGWRAHGPIIRWSIDFRDPRDKAVTATRDVLNAAALSTISIQRSPQGGQLDGQVVRLYSNIMPDGIHDLASRYNLSAAIHQ